jgi:hypothetical protein
MKAKSIFILAFMLLIISSCNKEIVPDREMIIGVWTTKNYSLNTEIEFTSNKFYQTTNSQLRSDEFYSIRNSTLYLYPNKIFDTENFSTHTIYLNKKTNELRIWGLGGSISDNDGFATFVKE